MFFRKVDVNLVLSFGIIAATEEKEETFYVKNVDVNFISESEDLRSYNFDGVFDEKIKELILGVSLWCSYKPWLLEKFFFCKKVVVFTELIIIKV